MSFLSDVSGYDLATEVSRLGDPFSVNVYDSREELFDGSSKHWVPADELWDLKSGYLASIIDGLTEKENLPKPAAACILFQRYATRLAAPVLAASAHWQLSFDVRVDQVYCSVSDHGIDKIAMPNRTVSASPVAACEALLDHLVVAIDVFHRHTNLGNRNLWGGAAVGVAHMCRLMHDTDSDDVHKSRYIDIAHSLLDRPGLHRLRGLGSVIIVSTGNKQSIRFARKTCCLAFKGVQQGYCQACPVRPDDERDRLWVRSVRNSLIQEAE